MRASTDTLMTCREAGRRLGITRQWVQMLIHRGELPAMKLGVQWFLARRDVEQFRRGYKKHARQA